MRERFDGQIGVVDNQIAVVAREDAHDEIDYLDLGLPRDSEIVDPRVELAPDFTAELAYRARLFASTHRWTQTTLSGVCWRYSADVDRAHALCTDSH